MLGECYLSKIEEETGVLASFREVGEKHCDTDEEHSGVLAHFTQRLAKRKARNDYLITCCTAKSFNNMLNACLSLKLNIITKHSKKKFWGFFGGFFLHVVLIFHLAALNYKCPPAPCYTAGRGYRSSLLTTDSDCRRISTSQ